ncbi:hypothetical protein [Halalkalicoccus subterraneus]|uniref:hypothetical protein n=1 Tax=Halalkalicoccus subterraneus TaxID=2675002 RepID=UPI000EFBB848|nr:hypothetical protein [Halalkalicoccus subterraneus]
MKRRRFLVGVGGAAALAGCLESTRERYPWPVIDEQALSEWERYGERSDQYDVTYRGIDALSVHERTHTYDHSETRRSIAELSRGEVDRSFARFVASRMTLEGIGRRFATPERLVDDAMAGVESGFRTRGLESIERVDPVDPHPEIDGELVEYRAERPLPSFSREVSVGGFSTTVEFAGTPLEMEGTFAVWKPEVETAYVAGGVFPAAGALEALLPEGIGTDALDAFAGQFDSARLRERVVSLVEATG